MVKPKSPNPPRSAKKADPPKEKEFAKDLNPNPKISPLPKRQLGTLSHMVEISDTLFDDDLYN
jgi:hypothetical protein